MSDEFDKEAEREKLREKYEADQEDRESTQRMSELLLQGATMTGKHCNNCGDPIFRYDGQEFCPSCQNAANQGGQAEPSESVEGSEIDESEVTPEAAADQRTDPESATADPEHATTDQTDAGNEPHVEINDVRVAGQHSHDAHGRRQSQHDDRSGASREPASDRGRRGQSARSVQSSPDGDLADARSSLVRKLTDLARQAEQTDDVARSRELLAATREAAEALEALDRANR